VVIDLVKKIEKKAKKLKDKEKAGAK